MSWPPFIMFHGGKMLINSRKILYFPIEILSLHPIQA